MLISFAVTAKLICVFVFAYAKSRFSHDEAQFISMSILSPSQTFKVLAHFQKIKLGFIEAFFIFLSFPQNIECSDSLEHLNGGFSTDYPLCVVQLCLEQK